MNRAWSAFTRPGAALDLAVLRITVALVLLGSSSIASAEHWARLPEAARTWPYGVGWMRSLLPIDPSSVQAVQSVFWIAGVLGALGLFSRTSFALLAITASYLLLVPQLGGAVFHDHHLLWLAVLLAASPCGDALSLDAWFARRGGNPLPHRGRAHGIALRLAWVVLGLVYLFPGIHKLAESGLAWAWSDNLRNQMWWKWAQDPALLPSLRIDRFPLVCRLLAALTIVFELSFLPLLAWRRTRVIAVLGALAFHAGSQYFMGIQFSVLWLCYTMFVPWDALARRWGSRWGWRKEGEASTPVRSLKPLAIVAPPLLLGILTFGALGQMQAYPFACYPTFEWMARDEMPALAIELEHPDGTREALDRSAFQEAGPRGWALSWRLSGVYGHFDVRALEAWWRDVASRPEVRASLSDADAVHFYRTSISVDPDGEHEERSRRELLVLPAN